MQEQVFGIGELIDEQDALDLGERSEDIFVLCIIGVCRIP